VLKFLAAVALATIFLVPGVYMVPDLQMRGVGFFHQLVLRHKDSVTCAFEACTKACCQCC